MKHVPSFSDKSSEKSKSKTDSKPRNSRDEDKDAAGFDNPIFQKSTELYHLRKSQSFTSQSVASQQHCKECHDMTIVEETLASNVFNTRPITLTEPIYSTIGPQSVYLTEIRIPTDAGPGTPGINTIKLFCHN